MIKETAPGVVGNCASAGAFALAWFTANALPILHVISILVGIGASIGTAGYYFVAWRKEWHKPRRRSSVRRKRKAKR